MSDNMQRCGSCGRGPPSRDLAWVKDRYGIPHKKVCWDCREQTEDEISRFKFDPSYAGERLESDY